MSTIAWQIRAATLHDAETLVDFNCRMAWETENKRLASEVVTRGVLRGLERGEEVRYFLADLGGDPIGSLMLTREWSDWRDGWLVWIQSVYVEPAHRGRGVFRSLLKHAIREMRQNPDVIGFRLYVENDNKRAQTVYARSGFSDPSYKVMEKLLPADG